MCKKCNNKTEEVKYARKCDECESGMNEGFVIRDGEEYYCSKKCLHKHYSPAKYKKMYDDGEGDSYWTQWDEETDFYYKEVGGKLIEVEP